MQGARPAHAESVVCRLAFVVVTVSAPLSGRSGTCWLIACGAGVGQRERRERAKGARGDGRTPCTLCRVTFRAIDVPDCTRDVESSMSVFFTAKLRLRGATPSLSVSRGTRVFVEITAPRGPAHTPTPPRRPTAPRRGLTSAPDVLTRLDYDLRSHGLIVSALTSRTTHRPALLSAL